MIRVLIGRVAPVLTAVAAVGAVALWLLLPSGQAVGKRTCIMPDPEDLTGGRVGINGKLVPGDGKPMALLQPVSPQWLCFRGSDRDNIVKQPGPLARQWPAEGPPVLWSAEVGEGHAGPVVRGGCVYVMDYDRENQADALRCLSLADGREVWRYTYPVKIKRNHGMSRTVPAIADGRIVALGPKCHVICCDVASGELAWSMDLVQRFGTTVPPWYAGQCPLIDEGRVILAPGGEALLIAVDLKTGEVVWETPNPMRWKMTHSSVTPMRFAGRKMYVYVASGGAVGVDAETGQLLWRTDQWRVKIAAVPSPVPLPEGRVFFSGGYNAGSMMVQLVKRDGGIEVKEQFRLEAETFGADQQTPIWYRDHLFGIRPGGGERGELVCLDPSGNIVWAAGHKPALGLGPLIIADGLLYALGDRGDLHLFEADPAACKPLASAKVLDGHDAWAPMAIAAGRLLCRDLTTLICLDVSQPD